MVTLKFCIKILFRASRWYSLVLIKITIIASIVPFVSLDFSSKLIQFLSENIGSYYIPYKEVIFILAAIFFINLFSKVIEYMRSYMNTLLNELVDKETDLLLINIDLFIPEEKHREHLFSKDVGLNDIALLYLVYLLEEQYKIHLTEEDFINKDFFSINGLTNCIYHHVVTV